MSIELINYCKKTKLQRGQVFHFHSNATQKMPRTTSAHDIFSVLEANSRAGESIYGCELERRAKALVDHYKILFSYQPKSERDLLEQRKRLAAALTPCTFVKSKDQWKTMKCILQEGRNVDAPSQMNDSVEFIYVGVYLFGTPLSASKVEPSKPYYFRCEVQNTITLPIHFCRLAFLAD